MRINADARLQKRRELMGDRAISRRLQRGRCAHHNRLAANQHRRSIVLLPSTTHTEQAQARRGCGDHTEDFANRSRNQPLTPIGSAPLSFTAQHGQRYFRRSVRRRDYALVVGGSLDFDAALVRVERQGRCGDRHGCHKVSNPHRHRLTLAA
jgi:hypothetical protein